jgi:hypothetical protein
MINGQRKRGPAAAQYVRDEMAEPARQPRQLIYLIDWLQGVDKQALEFIGVEGSHRYNSRRSLADDRFL